MEIVQILGMTFVGIIIICLGMTVVQVILGHEGPSDRNKRLLDRANTINTKLINK
jgi:hypothetical protein